jgi:hypothetical protein
MVPRWVFGNESRCSSPYPKAQSTLAWKRSRSPRLVPGDCSEGDLFKPREQLHSGPLG